METIRKCPFCDGKMKIEKLTEQEIYLLDDIMQNHICPKHINEIFDKIAREEI